MPTLPKTLFESSQAGHKAYNLPKSHSDFEKYQPSSALKRQSPLMLPEHSELELLRHFNALSHCTVGVENTFYPLGSCTMKYNPRVHEHCAALDAFQNCHPLAPTQSLQGSFFVMDALLKQLCELTGMPAGTLLPNAGAQGEFVALRMIQAYHRARNDNARTQILIPAHAHGTNPASAAMAGYEILTVNIDETGDIDLDHLEQLLGEKTAALMLTNPSTLGLFSKRIPLIAKKVHKAGGLLYYDGANFNAIITIVEPAAMGFDILHLNLHKTFSTPHGGGGPGAGPVLCQDYLKKFLPHPHIVKEGVFFQTERNSIASIGQIASFFGNFTVCLKAYAYIRSLGKYGLRKVAEVAVLHANYLMEKLKEEFTIPFTQRCMHEFVVQADRFLDKGVRAFDIAKRLLDYGVYAPTIYFPLMIKECMLIEPTETESKQSLDKFAEVVKKIIIEIEENPEIIRTAPHNLPVGRLDETQAARNPKIRTS